MLTILERQGATPVRRLVRELDWPAPLVLMAVGALIRDGMVRAVQHDLEVMVQPIHTLRTAQAEVPAIWGG